MTKQSLVNALVSAQDVSVSMPVICKPVMVKLQALMNESDKIDVNARRLIALAVIAAPEQASDFKHGSHVEYIHLAGPYARQVDARTQLLRDQNDRLVGFPAITGG